MAGILGAIGIIDLPDFYTLTFHDENDTTGHTWTLNNNDTRAVGHGQRGAERRDRDDNLSARRSDSPLTINGGSGGNTFIVNNTTSLVETDLNTGTGDDTVNVFATGADTLNINGQDGMDTVTLGATGRRRHAEPGRHDQCDEHPRLQRVDAG